MVSKLEYETAYGVLRMFYHYPAMRSDLEYHLKAYVDMFAPIPKDALLLAYKSLKFRDNDDLLNIPLPARRSFQLLFNITVCHNPMLGRRFREHSRLIIRIRNNG